MIASGKTVSDIARELSLSVKTVSEYRARLLAKMKLKNSAELTHYAIRNQLVGSFCRVGGSPAHAFNSREHCVNAWARNLPTLQNRKLQHVQIEYLLQKFN